jgi:hypothetical protein
MSYLDPLNEAAPHSTNQDEIYVLDDLDYIIKFTEMLYVLYKGCDITQLPDGSIIISKTKVVNTYYKWDNSKKKFVKAAQYDS